MKFEIETEGFDLNNYMDQNYYDYIRMISDLDKKSNLTSDDIHNALEDLTDDGIIEIINIKKVYYINKVPFHEISYIGYDDLDKRYIFSYKINIFIKLTKEEKLKDYISLRDDYFKNLMWFLFKHRIINIESKRNIFNMHLIERIELSQNIRCNFTKK